MLKSLFFIFIVFMMAKFYFKKFRFKKRRMTSSHKIVFNVDIGILLTWNFWKTFKTKFDSVRNCGRPKPCRNFSVLKEKLWQGTIYPSPWRIGLSQKNPYCKDVIDFIHSLQYLGGWRAVNFLRGPMNINQKTRGSLQNHYLKLIKFGVH